MHTPSSAAIILEIDNYPGNQQLSWKSTIILEIDNYPGNRQLSWKSMLCPCT